MRMTGNPTYVMDCIDDVTTKVALLEAATVKGLKIITATGAGAKADPTRLQIGSLKDVVRTFPLLESTPHWLCTQLWT